ncbi:MAG: efflux RND transporter permease subunit [Betaproteobacteria bacterium]|nr:efflux RND transporter permease subunit [Betaproteobacteria bacterium]
MLRLLIEYCVHRRTAALFATVVVAIFGLRAYLDTPIEAYPDVTNTQVTVITQLPGNAPEEIERRITVPLERELNGTPGMTLMRSESLFGLSLITLTFSDDTNSFVARTVVSQRVAIAELPSGATPELAPEATPLGEVYQFRLASDRHDLYQLRAEMQWTVVRALRQVQGVADIVPFGGYVKEAHVQADPARLFNHGLTLADLEQALAKANLNVGAGFLRHGDQELTVRGIGYLESAEDIKRIALKSKAGTPVTVGDLANVVQSYTPRRGAVGVGMEKEGVESFIWMRRGQNPSRVLDGIHDKVRELNEKILPKGMQIETFYDRSDLVGLTLATVHKNLLSGFLLVVGVVWLFLRSIVSSVVVATVIPLSLLVAFLGLHMLGLPANLISMGAIDFGILVDGAVVLVENVIHALRHERPTNRRGVLQLVVRSAVDIGRPTLYAMLIIIAALVPVFTLQSVEGRIFRPLALTYSFALAGALVFALTMVPALCAVLFRPRHAQIKDPGWVDMLRNRYRQSLNYLLGRRPVVLIAAVVLLLLGGLTIQRLGTEFLPELDEGDIQLFVEMPPSIALASGQDILLEVRRRILTFPEVRKTMSEQGRPEDGTDNEDVNMSETFIRLKPVRDWRAGYDKKKLIDEMRALLSEIPGVRYNFSQPMKDNVEEAVSGVRGKVVLKIFGPDLAKMRATLEHAKEALKEVPGIVDLDLYRDTMKPQLQIRLSRPQLARAGITIDDAQRAIETALVGRVATIMWEGERPVPVRILFPLSERDDIEKIGAITLQSESGARIPLRDLSSITTENALASINREGNIRYLALKFNIEGRSMGSVVEEAINTLARSVQAPEDHYFTWGGEFENQQRALARLKLVVPLAVLAVLLLLYVAMSSGYSALAILLTAPFALTGGAFALFIAEVPLSVSAAVGFIALLGQVSLMGLLVLSATDARRRTGEALLPALVEGASERLRPVLMACTLALVGLLPMALSHGVGSETQRPFALVVVGGMITALVVSLWLLPTFYSYITPKRLKTPEEEDAEIEDNA